MDSNIISTTRVYEALPIQSPMMFGDGRKDQDRARWYEPGLIACVCDGVTSSPNSAEAAELASSCVPFIFSGNVRNRLAMLCELLMARRQECQKNKDVILPEGTPAAMQQMLRRIIMQKRATAYQTTMVAAKFISDYKAVVAHVIKCGDSGFFASSPAGELLSSSLSFPFEAQNPAGASDERSILPPVPDCIGFGPGDEILVRVDGSLSLYRSLSIGTGIRPEHIRNWLVCTPVDSCHNGDNISKQNLSELQVLSLKPQDRLLVPSFLYGAQLTSKGQQYRVLRYSSTIRCVPSSESVAPVNSFGDRSSSTMVLPDHFYCGCFDSYQDRFPLGTHFILCSDGFYSSFSDWHQLWAWIEQNATGLNDSDKRETILEQLHLQLNNKRGDDDISFVWVKPKTLKVPDDKNQHGNCEEE